MEMALSTEQAARDYWTKCLQARLVIADSKPTSATSKETIDHARNALFVDLQAIRDLIPLANAYVNDLSITARLPTEVMSHVFAVLSDCDPPSKPDDRLGGRRRLGWITVTHVSQRWRRAALSTPTLWTKIGTPQTGRWMKEMLKRSKQVPFTLSADITQNIGVCQAVMKAVGPKHIWRMKALCLSNNAYGGRFQGWTVEVLAGLKRPAPMLESLTLENVTGSDTLPPTIFAGNLPSLCCFSAHNLYGKGWDASHIRNLTDLELHFKVNASLATLLILLKNSPALETLKIIRSKNGTPEERLPDGRISLFSLKTLYFSSQVDTTCTQFMASLIIPPTTRIEFKFRGGDVEKMLCIISLIPAFVGMEDSSTLSSPPWMRLACNRYSGCIQVLLDTWLEDINKISGTPPFSMEWNISSPTGCMSIVRQLLASFDLRRVTCLVLDSDKLDESVLDTLKESFSRMPAVRDLGLRGVGTGPLLCLLETTCIGIPPYPQISDVGGQETNNGSLLFPSLMRLKIMNAPFGDATPEDKGGDPFGYLLLDAVQKRSALGARIHTLHLPIEKRKCSKAMLHSLRKHVEILRR